MITKYPQCVFHIAALLFKRRICVAANQCSGAGTDASLLRAIV